MPYVALPVATRDARLAVARARWDAILPVRPDLLPAIALQRSLIEPVIELTRQLAETRVPRLSLPPKYLAAKLGRRIPALGAEPIPMPTAALKPTLLELCQRLSEGGAGEPAMQIHALLDAGTLDAGAVLAATLIRDQKAIRMAAVHRHLQSELVWLVAELAVSPYVYCLQQVILGEPGGRLDAGLHAALDQWDQGYCPICGSWPAIVEAMDGRSILRCSFCALAWTLSAPGCAYCGNTGPEFVVATPNPGRPDRRIETCGKCRSYMKAIDVDELSMFPLGAIGDLETMDLDVQTMKQGFQRPPTKVFSPSKPI